MMPDSWLKADWPAPEGVHCLVTTRDGGASTGPYAACNLGLHVGDEAARVEENRRRLWAVLGTDVRAQWIRQVHGTRVLVPEQVFEAAAQAPEADAIYTRRAGLACAVLTADCLPVCFCDATGGEIAVAHAGWRGLAGGVLENTLACFRAAPRDILAWLGPAIGPCHFEVGGEVRAAFLEDAAPASREELLRAFHPAAEAGKWMADLYALARARLRAAGLTGVHGGGLCTFCDARRFYSYRREPVTGRFATLIWRS